MKLKSKLFYSYILFLVVYGGFTLVPGPSSATLKQYHVSALGIRFIDATLIAILAAIWFAGFYGYAKFNEYVKLIQENTDGEAVLKLSRGVLLVVMWLPISAATSAILNYIALRHASFLPASKIIENYINLLVPLAGFIYISWGSRKLSEVVGQRPSYMATNVLALLLTYLGVVYIHFVATTHNRGAVYHLPMWLLLTTLVAPYIYMWFMGLLAVYEIYQYRQKVQGIVYRSSWGLLSFGLGWLILVTIGLQFLTSLSARLNHLSIYGILGVIYVLLLMFAVGFMIIASGTRKLQRIEEV